MRRLQVPEPKKADSHVLVAKEYAIKTAAEEIAQSSAQAAMADARTAALWIAANRPDVAMGAEAELLLVADDDEFTLPELEDYGRAGNAIKLCSGIFGDLWWCDPEGRKVFRHQCLLFANKATHGASARTILLRFNRPQAF